MVRFKRATERGSAQHAVATLAKPSCLVVDEVGRCVFDRACTDLFFDVIDRRYEKEGQHHDPHEQRGAELLGRVPRGGRGPALRLGSATSPSASAASRRSCASTMSDMFIP
ncbi:MAG: ATP-binding protein [Olsenella sp.]|jgi:hypothetical protein|nr:ATP-binding protein [Olsenella sp.]